MSTTEDQEDKLPTNWIEAIHESIVSRGQPADVALPFEDPAPQIEEVRDCLAFFEHAAVATSGHASKNRTF